MRIGAALKLKAATVGSTPPGMLDVRMFSSIVATAWSLDQWAVAQGSGRRNASALDEQQALGRIGT